MNIHKVILLVFNDNNVSETKFLDEEVNRITKLHLFSLCSKTLYFVRGSLAKGKFISIYIFIEVRSFKVLSIFNIYSSFGAMVP